MNEKNEATSSYYLLTSGVDLTSSDRVRAGGQWEQWILSTRLWTKKRISAGNPTSSLKDMLLERTFNVYFRSDGEKSGIVTESLLVDSQWILLWLNWKGEELKSTTSGLYPRG